MKASRRVCSLEEMRTLACELANNISPGDQVGFSGPLGAGKTALVRLLVDAWGSGDPVSSPTFVLCHEYGTSAGIAVEHWDLYRIDEASVPEELTAPPDSRTIRCIEWIERAPSVQRDATLLVTIAVHGEHREVSWTKT